MWADRRKNQIGHKLHWSAHIHTAVLAELSARLPATNEPLYHHGTHLFPHPKRLDTGKCYGKPERRAFTAPCHNEITFSGMFSARCTHTVGKCTSAVRARQSQAPARLPATNVSLYRYRCLLLSGHYSYSRVLTAPDNNTLVTRHACAV